MSAFAASGAERRSIRRSRTEKERKLRHWETFVLVGSSEKGSKQRDLFQAIPRGVEERRPGLAQTRYAQLWARKDDETKGGLWIFYLPFSSRMVDRDSGPRLHDSNRASTSAGTAVRSDLMLINLYQKCLRFVLSRWCVLEKYFIFHLRSRTESKADARFNSITVLNTFFNILQNNVPQIILLER